MPTEPLPNVPWRELCGHEIVETSEWALTCELREGHEGPHAADHRNHRVEWRPLDTDGGQADG